ncbi:MAG TPA: ATP-binding cassette domain-containing protein [Vicinamibacteria bacterium]|nr:ATP-binding cassette domain-containing protein [Vicinamibacteria bacterium]
MIEYLDVHKAFDVPVLAGVDLTVETGEILAIVGPSGTGKSVLLKTTIGLIVPDRGDVRINGESVYAGGAAGLQTVRQKVGYVFQYAALFDSMNVYENLAFGLPDEEVREIGRREVLRRVVEALDSVNLDARQVMAKLPAALSGGMRKRVGLARAIIRRPEILLYDEPVTGLDPVNGAAIDQLIVEIARRKSVTSVVVTHDIEGVLTFCDRIALLHSGKLVFLGTPQGFRTCPNELVRAFADRQAAGALAAREAGRAPAGDIQGVPR